MNTYLCTHTYTNISRVASTQQFLTLMCFQLLYKNGGISIKPAIFDIPFQAHSQPHFSFSDSSCEPSVTPQSQLITGPLFCRGHSAKGQSAKYIQHINLRASWRCEGASFLARTSSLDTSCSNCIKFSLTWFSDKGHNVKGKGQKCNLFNWYSIVT